MVLQKIAMFGRAALISCVIVGACFAATATGAKRTAAKAAHAGIVTLAPIVVRPSAADWRALGARAPHRD